MSIDTDYRVLRDVLASRDWTGQWAAEFGVYSGYSLDIIAGHMPVVGFDSFKGLPEDWRPEFPKGAFATKDAGALYSRGPKFNQMLVQGWFDDTVPTFPFPALGLVHIDCDLYSSTVTALDGVLGSISSGSILVFDEHHGYPGWEQHEAKAWDEFCDKHEIVSEAIGEGAEEKAFRILSIGGSL